MTADLPIEIEHFIGDAYYQFEERFLDCSCGFTARGSSWREVGIEMDDHLEESDQ